jgi:(p)ppGpp synthase/HD superfamily hydrolase
MGKKILTKEGLQEIISGKVTSLDVNKILSAWEMAENVHHEHYLVDGTKYMEHISRVCSIVVEEIEVFEPDIIIASLLHDIYSSSQEITREIITYNFGSYVTFLIEDITDEFSIERLRRVVLASGYESTMNVTMDDYLIIRLAQHLDNFRFIDFSPIYDPLNYIIDIRANYLLPLQNSENPSIKYLITELKKEINKFFC